MKQAGMSGAVLSSIENSPAECPSTRLRTSRRYESQEMMMATSATTQRVKAKKRVGTKEQVSANPKTPNLAPQTSPLCSADHSDKCRKTGGLAEALREEGIDERAIAQGFASLHSKLRGSEDKGDLKLFFDVLKENHRTLEPPSASDRSSANDGPVTIILKHNVPRPVR